MKRMLGMLTVLGFLFLSGNVVKAEDMIAKDKIVKFDYTLTVDGKVVDSSSGKEPLQYTQGQNMIIPGLEKQMEGMKVGDEKTIAVPAADAYGAVNPALIIKVAKTNLAPDFKAEVGGVVQMNTPEGQAVPGVIKEIQEDGLMVDFNHPLAGKDLSFQIKIVEIK